MHLRLGCCLWLAPVLTIKCELRQEIYREYVNRNCPNCGLYPAFCWNDPELWCDRCKHTWKARGRLDIVGRYAWVDHERAKLLEREWNCFASEGAE